MKKIFLLFIFILLGFNQVFALDIGPIHIDFGGGGGGFGGISGDLAGSGLIESGNMSVEEGLRNLLLHWTFNIGSLLSIMAVFGIVYGSLRMVVSAGEEEQVKKGKNIVKWSIIGFLGVVLSGTIISVITEFIYSF